MGATNYSAHLRPAPVKVCCTACSTELKPLGVGDWEPCPVCQGNDLAKQVSGPFKDVDMAQMYPEQEVFEHHVLLTFTHDEDAEFFREWWGDIGSAAFNEWHKKRETEEQ